MTKPTCGKPPIELIIAVARFGCLFGKIEIPDLIFTWILGIELDSNCYLLLLTKNG